MSLSRLKNITSKQLYFGYPYKKNLPHAFNTVPDPYIRKQDLSDSPDALDYQQWCKLMDIYLGIFREILASGNKFKMPHMMGILEINKYKAKRFLDFVASAKAGKRIYMGRNGLDNMALELVWKRGWRHAKLNFKWHWKVKINRKFVKSIYDRCNADYTYINKFEDI